MRRAVIIALIVLSGAAQARWKAQYSGAPYSPWYKAAKNCHGGDCCGSADASPYFGGYSMNADGSVTLDGGEHIDACKVLTGPNPTKAAVLWKSPSGTTYCFALGPGT